MTNYYNKNGYDIYCIITLIHYWKTNYKIHGQPTFPRYITLLSTML